MVDAALARLFQKKELVSSAVLTRLELPVALWVMFDMVLQPNEMKLWKFRNPAMYHSSHVFMFVVILLQALALVSSLNLLFLKLGLIDLRRGVEYIHRWTRRGSARLLFLA